MAAVNVKSRSADNETEVSVAMRVEALCRETSRRQERKPCFCWSMCRLPTASLLSVTGRYVFLAAEDLLRPGRGRMSRASCR